MMEELVVLLWLIAQLCAVFALAAAIANHIIEPATQKRRKNNPYEEEKNDS